MDQLTLWGGVEEVVREEVVLEPLPEVALSGEQSALFERGSFAEHPEVGEIVERHVAPTFRRRERLVALAFSFDSEEDRDRLAEILDVPITKGGNDWSCYYPALEDDELRLEAV